MGFSHAAFVGHRQEVSACFQTRQVFLCRSKVVRACPLVGVVRAITTYPHNVGRSVEEMLRIVAALQCAAGDKVLTPEGWQPGDAVLLPPATESGGEAGADWFCKSTAAP